MGKILSKLLGKSSSADISSAITKAQAELEAAEAAVAAAENSYDEGLLTLDKLALRKLLDAKVEAQIEIDQVRAKIAKLEKQHEAALEAEAAERRQVAYDQAKAAAEAARKKLTTEYPRLAKDLRELLKSIAESDILVEAANQDLPAGAERLEKAEDFRSQPNRYREERGQAVVDAWVPIGDRSSPLPDDMQRRVRPDERVRRDGTQGGKVQTETGSWLEVERRRFTRVEFLPHEDGRFVAPLAAELNLPPLHVGATPYHQAADHPPYRIVAELEKQLLPPPVRAERTPQVEWRIAPKEEVADV
ncbi:hypothetical protein [Shinella sp.]|uniref:hypothetical protein n=1 Tax=Shinella sp. TaxID=1870904 RepID=UPI003F6EDD30